MDCAGGLGVCIVLHHCSPSCEQVSLCIGSDKRDNLVRRGLLVERDDYVAGGIGVFVVYVVVSRAPLH